APGCHGCGASRTHTSTVTLARVNFGSRKVRLGPLTSTVRAPSVKVARRLPFLSCTRVRAGLSARSKTQSAALGTGADADVPASVPWCVRLRTVNVATPTATRATATEPNTTTRLPGDTRCSFVGSRCGTGAGTGQTARGLAVRRPGGHRRGY